MDTGDWKLQQGHFQFSLTPDVEAELRLKSQRERLKPEGRESQEEKRRRVWGLLSGRVCRIWSKFSCSSFRERRRCL